MLSLGDKRTLGLLLCIFFGLSLALVTSGIVTAFTGDVARSVNVSTSFMLLFCYNAFSVYLKIVL